MNEINDQTGKGGERNLCTHRRGGQPSRNPRPGTHTSATLAGEIFPS